MPQLLCHSTHAGALPIGVGMSQRARTSPSVTLLLLSMRTDLPIGMRGYIHPVYALLHTEADRGVAQQDLKKAVHVYIKIILLMSVLWCLSACTVTPARVEVRQPAVIVPGVTVEQPHPVRHCPPGHAKKGWC